MKPFDLLHVDIWEPYKEESITGVRYFLIIVDYHTRTTGTFMMQFKGQSLHFLSRFLKMIDNQFEAKAKVIRSDNGYEFLSRECQNLFENRGIIH